MSELLKGINSSFRKGCFKTYKDKPTEKEFFSDRSIWRKRFPTEEKLKEAWAWCNGSAPEKEVETLKVEGKAKKD